MGGGTAVGLDVVVVVVDVVVGVQNLVAAAAGVFAVVYDLFAHLEGVVDIGILAEVANQQDSRPGYRHRQRCRPQAYHSPNELRRPAQQRFGRAQTRLIRLPVCVVCSV